MPGGKDKQMKKTNKGVYILLHVLLAFYSLSGVLSKMSAQQKFLSLPFFACYGGMLAVLFLYALGWQQILKRLPLSVAFANKAAMLVWSMLYGVIFFHETIRWTQIAGCALAAFGVILFVNADRTKEQP